MTLNISIPTRNPKQQGKNDGNYLFNELPKRILKFGSLSLVAVTVTFKPLTCVLADTYTPMEYLAISGTSSVYINKTGEFLNESQYFPDKTTIIQGHPQPVGNIVVCRDMLIGNCSSSFIFLQRHEYDMFPNRSLLYKAGGRLYRNGEYTWKNGTIMICTNLKRTYRKEKKDSNNTRLGILTYIGFSISIVCLVFVLVTYSLFPTLRTIPGINLMNLSSALLVAHLLWLIASGLTVRSKSCKAVAIVLHCSFLSSFMWMSIIAVDTWRAFASNATFRSSRDDRGEKRKRIAFTMAVGWIPPIIMFSVCVALEKTKVFSFGYGGGERGCWINNSWAILYFFAVPVAMSLLWNAVFFLLTVRAIMKSRKQSQIVTRQHQDRKDIKVYAKIAALMGFTWVFGFVAPFTSDYLWYPFVVLNTLQGLYIAVAFCCTQRVRLLYQSLYSQTENPASRGRVNLVAETKL